ncbi:relaxase/mobilization nuclease domain-containing protein [Asticcacaulis machinosus]|uniref:DUF3363 domain-containing protein n=1 Tax=Asticcacaulis machinosus TaxID=2984211 RepID=A0ABT5HIU3_9CAUL|nr:DUF3363 domain-containing protein [Asticcacaulis machinosus]MDC7675519.1 DUF3363 domain-containing protein [Asticcacaulis machinosus]
MTDEDHFTIRPGTIRSRGRQRLRPALHQILAATRKAGGQVTRTGAPKNRAHVGRGGRRGVSANRKLMNAHRRVLVKARIVRQGKRAGGLAAHLRYLQREGVTRDQSTATLFGPEATPENVRELAKAFAERCASDRHHFRFIISPEDAAELSDLKRFARDLMAQAASDLNTRLDWVGIAHWNTAHPHLHIILRGTTDLGEDLVISRAYITSGLRGRAQDLVENELGPKSAHEIEQQLRRQITAERLTNIDRQLIREGERHGLIDLAPPSPAKPSGDHTHKMARMRQLEAFGLANQVAPGQWLLSNQTAATLTAMGERYDIIKRLHKGLALAGQSRDAHELYLDLDSRGTGRVCGRLLDFGLDDELEGTGFAIIDATDGLVHHVRIRDPEGLAGARPGAIVETTPEFHARTGEAGIVVRSDLNLTTQIAAEGATWLDRTLVAATPLALSSHGFGAEVHDAQRQRVDKLIAMGLAERIEGKIRIRANLIATLTHRELQTTAETLSRDSGQTYRPEVPGDEIRGTYRRRLNLASGRYALIDEGLGFRLVPWSPSIERRLGQEVGATLSRTGQIAWHPKRDRGLEI